MEHNQRQTKPAPLSHLVSVRRVVEPVGETLGDLYRTLEEGAVRQQEVLDVRRVYGRVLLHQVRHQPLGRALQRARVTMCVHVTS